MSNKVVRGMLVFAPSIALGIVIILELLFKITIVQKLIVYAIIVIPSIAAIVAIDMKQRKSGK